MTRRQRINDLTTFAVPEQPALSPDGDEIVYVVRTSDVDADRIVRSVWQVGVRAGEPRQLTRGPGDTSPAWSPDRSRIVFLRAQEGPPQLWSLPVAGGEPEQLTTLPLGAGAPIWSPDGSRIAFAAPTDMHAVEGEDDAARAKRAAEPIVADRLDYQADGAGFIRTMRKHLHILDPETKQCRQVTRGDWHAGDPSWSPDGEKLAFAAATAPDADLRPRAPVHLLTVGEAASSPEPVALADGFGGAITWSRDGSSLLVVGWTGEPVGHQGLLRVPLAGGPVENLAEPLDRNVMPGAPAYPGGTPQLTGDGRAVLFCVRDRGCTHLYSATMDGGLPQPVIAGDGRVVSGLSVTSSTAAVALATPTSLGEIVVVDLATGDETVRTQHGESEVELYVREERTFTISDGAEVHGWLVRDPSAAEPQPLLLDIHGGPHNAWSGAADDSHLYHQELAARGWTILLLNPRGSDGYGEELYDGVRGAWGESDSKDFLEPIDDLIAEGVVDPKRLAVTGYSYGGYMTCFLTSRDNRFAAAVAGGIVADLTSMAGTSDLGHFLSEHELGGSPWAGRERYDAMSPFASVDRVETPTLILHGAADLRCPVGQAQQWHTALRERGVPTRLALYPEASHLFILEGKPSHRIDYNRRVIDWMEEYAVQTRPSIDQNHWQRRLAELAERHRVPGATLGILRVHPGRDDELVETAYGLLNKETGVETTTDSLFQIGSITKVWTATVAMQLVEEGLVDLDAPVANVLPELTLADPDVAKEVTLRQLLTHTSGIDGDIFTDTGRGDDAIEKYVAQLSDAAQNHPIGATWSYCNSGYTIAGRLIERLTDGTWDAAMRERLFTPLGLERTGTLPEEALLHRVAVGHVGDDNTRAQAWVLPRSAAPAGLINSTVADVLAFARMHLTGGLAADGTTRVLSEESTAAMQEHQADVPDKYLLGDSWGIGWIRFDWNGRRLIGHDGTTLGQASFLRVLPDEGLAVTLLTNGGSALDLYADLYREIFADLADVAMSDPLTPPAEPVDVDVQPHVGTYERASVQIEVLNDGDGPLLRTTVTGPIAELLPKATEEYALVAVEDNLFAVQPSQSEMWLPVTFYELPTGEKYMHFGARATPKVT